MNKITMTTQEVSSRLREVGVHFSKEMIVDGIASGLLPFGRVIRSGESGRRTILVFRKDLEQWIKDMTYDEEASA